MSTGLDHHHQHGQCARHTSIKRATASATANGSCVYLRNAHYAIQHSTVIICPRFCYFVSLFPIFQFFFVFFSIRTFSCVPFFLLLLLLCLRCFCNSFSPTFVLPTHTHTHTRNHIFPCGVIASSRYTI